MCGRYSVGARPEEIAEKLGASLAPGAADAPARFNVAPSQPAPLLVSAPDPMTGPAHPSPPSRRLGLARFGWTVRGRKPLLVNARMESIATNGLFRSAAERHRALVPADGFYEWAGEGKDKRAYFFHAPGGELLTFAALFDVGRAPSEASGPSAAPGAAGPGETPTSSGAKPPREPAFVILTRPAEGALESVHDRMPVVVPPELRDLWLSRAPLDEALSALGVAHVALEGWEVSGKVGSPKLDEPWLRDAIGPPPSAVP